jgi:hypothetical protein
MARSLRPTRFQRGAAIGWVEISASDYLQSLNVRTLNDSFRRKPPSTVVGSERLGAADLPLGLGGELVFPAA